MSPSAAHASDAERVVQAFEQLPRLAAADRDLARRGRFLTCDMEIAVGTMPLSVRVVRGSVQSVERGPFLLRPHAFTIAADAETWARFHEPEPAPGDHDLFALTKSGRARVSGDLVPFMGNLQFVKDLLALPRRLSKTGA